MLKTAASFAVAALSLSAVLSCRTQGTGTVTTEYRASPTALAFSTCPMTDSANKPVEGVFPDRQTVTINNDGRAPGGLKLSLSGVDAAAFKIIEPVPTSVAANGTAEVTISFSPAKATAYRARLTIDDETEGTDDVTVDLNGEGLSGLAAVPTLNILVEDETSTTFTDCDRVPFCELVLPRALMNQTSSAKRITLKNKGCPALNITSLSLTPVRSTNTDFALTDPTALPSATSPITIVPTTERSLLVTFTPIDDGTPETTRDAVLTIKSNDGLAAETSVALRSEGIKPSMYVYPIVCDFSAPSDRCGLATRNPGRAQFKVTNDGNERITLSKVALKNAEPRFQITSALQGTTLAAGASANLDVTYTDAPLQVNAELVIEAQLQNGTPAGFGSVALFGGTKPCLSTDPAATVNFNDPATETATAQVTLRNGAGCGTLNVSSVSVEASSFFSLGSPALAPNTQIAPGGTAAVTVRYKRPVSGGSQVGVLRIATNDPDYRPDKAVLLVSKTPLDELPVADLRACTPAQLASDPQCANGTGTTMTVSLTALPTRKVTLSGSKSFDPVPGMAGSTRPATKYKFSLLQPLPANVTTQNLLNHDTQVTSATTELTVVPQPGLYRLGLVVYDEKAQQSTASTLNINVTQ